MKEYTPVLGNRVKPLFTPNVPPAKPKIVSRKSTTSVQTLWNEIKNTIPDDNLEAQGNGETQSDYDSCVMSEKSTVDREQTKQVKAKKDLEVSPHETPAVTPSGSKIIDSERDSFPHRHFVKSSNRLQFVKNMEDDIKWTDIRQKAMRRAITPDPFISRKSSSNRTENEHASVRPKLLPNRNSVDDIQLNSLTLSTNYAVLSSVSSQEVERLKGMLQTTQQGAEPDSPSCLEFYQIGKVNRIKIIKFEKFFNHLFSPFSTPR